MPVIFASMHPHKQEIWHRAHLVTPNVVPPRSCNVGVLPEDFPVTEMYGIALLTYLVRHILASGLLKHVSSLIGDLLVRAALLCWVDLAYTPGC